MTESNLPPKAPQPERNLLGQLRTWTDIFPWLRLVGVLRVAGGPIWIAHVFLTMLIWLGGISFSLEQAQFESLTLSFRESFSLVYGASILSTSLGDLLVSLSWPVLGMVTALGWAGVLWTSLLWLPTSMLLIRAGALLTAGREMPSYLSTIRLVGQRLWAGLVILSLPLVCALPFWMAIGGVTALLVWFGSLFGESASHAIQWLSAVMVVPIAVVAGLLLAAGKFAVPLGLANLMTMAEADPMDSLSRGYEYTLRRLPQLLGYSLIALVLGGIVMVAWTMIGLTALAIMSGIGQAPAASTTVVGLLLVAISVMLAWAMFGGVYLLLRQSAGGQEVEDIWAESDAIVAPEMPSVERD